MLLVIGGVLASGSWGQGPVESQEPFIDRVAVDLVNLDVTVTRRDGTPVTGLSADDFRVRDDGAPVAVSHFVEVRQGRPALQAEPTAEKPEADSAPGKEPQLAENQRLSLIVFVDNFNLKTSERNRVLPDVNAFVGRALGPGDRVMVVSFNPGLEVRQPFTQDLQRVRDSLSELKRVNAHSGLRDRERRDVLQRIDRAESPEVALNAARNFAGSVANDVEATIRGLRGLVDSLGGLPGRKALLYVSSGLPMVAGEEMFLAVENKFGDNRAYSEIPRYDHSRRFESLTAAASSHRVAFYTLDAGGLRTGGLGAADSEGLSSPGLRVDVVSAMQSNLHSSLSFLAQETGGKALLHRNEVLPALRQVAVEFQSFYSLGFASSHGADGRYHRLEVELRNPQLDGKRLEVRHRDGYRGRGSVDRVLEGVRTALKYDFEDNPLGVAIAVDPLQRNEAGEYLVEAVVEIPLANVVFLPLPEGKFETRLALFVGAIDDKGRLSAIDQLPLGIRLAGEHLEAAREQSQLYRHQLLLRPGRQRIVFGLLDKISLEASYVRRFVDLGG